MGPFLVDEDLPRSLATVLRGAGISAEDVRDVGLRGTADDAVLRYAQAKGLALITGDVGFSNILRYPLGSHRGIVVARFPNEMPADSLSAAILASLRDLSDPDVKGNLVILSPGRIRLRRHA